MRDGATYNEPRDGARLNAQQVRVWECMKDGQWRALHVISSITGDPEASISARLRDFRKERFGSHSIDRRYVTNGLWEYRLLVNRVDLFAEVGPRAALPRCEHFPGHGGNALSADAADPRGRNPT